MVRSEGMIEQMVYEMDSEITAVLAHVLEQSEDLPAIERGDWKTHRERGNIGQAYLASLVSSSPDVRLTSFSTMTQDDTPIELRWYTKKTLLPVPLWSMFTEAE